jgi:hypothetical protein
MTLTRIITHTATIAAAATALAAPAATARPADAHATVTTTAAVMPHKQEHRSAGVIGTGSLRRHAGVGAVRGYPTRPAQDEQANPRPDATTSGVPAERDRPWTASAIAIAAGLLALAAIGATLRRTRHGGRGRLAA